MCGGRLKFFQNTQGMQHENAIVLRECMFQLSVHQYFVLIEAFSEASSKRREMLCFSQSLQRYQFYLIEIWIWYWSHVCVCVWVRDIVLLRSLHPRGLALQHRPLRPLYSGVHTMPIMFACLRGHWSKVTNSCTPLPSSLPPCVVRVSQLHKQREVTDSISTGIKYALTNPWPLAILLLNPLRDALNASEEKINYMH